MSGPRYASARHGITLVELMVALLIMGLIAGATSRLLARSWQSEEVTNDQNVAQKTAQRAVDAIVDSLRAGAMVTSGDAGEITVAFANDADPVTFDMTTFSLEGHALQRVHARASGEILTELVVPDFLTALSFRYQQHGETDWQDSLLATAADVVVVSVTATSGRCSATETSFVTLRNKT